MSWATESFTMSSENLTLRPLEARDIPAAAVALQDPGGWASRHWGTETPEKAEAFLRKQLGSRALGESLPLIYFVNEEVAGVTSLHNFSERRLCLEIGITLVSPKFRRSRVNTEVKRMLFTHAFDRLKAVRVELRVDSLNYVSQTAVLRLGARFEGKIKHWVVRGDNSSPDGMLYSVVKAEWPKVKERLDLLCEGKAPPSPFLAAELAGPRLRLTLSRQQDAPELLDLALRNHKSLEDSFPQLCKLTGLPEAQSYIAERAHTAASGSGFHYVAREKNSGALIGHLQVKNLDWHMRSTELGYLLDADFRGMGLAQEMLALVLEELREKHSIARITARILPENAPSIGLARRLGFNEEGRLRLEHKTARGEQRDVILFSLTAGS